MLRQLDVANHYQVLLRFYYDKLNIKQHRKQICRKRHDLVHDQGKFFIVHYLNCDQIYLATI